MNRPIAWDLVADIYDTYVTADFDIPFWMQEASTASNVLELMAGTGRVSVPLAAHHVKLTCLDASEAMLEKLRSKLDARGLKAEVVHQDVRDLSLGEPFDLVILPLNSISEITSVEDRQAVLRRIHDHLLPGGRFICTLHNPAVRQRNIDGQLRVAGTYRLGENGERLVLSVAEARGNQPGIVEGKQFYEFYDPKGTLYAKRLLEIRFALIDKGAFEAQAMEAGLRTEAIYGDYDRRIFEASSSPYMIWVLREH